MVYKSSNRRRNVMLGRETPGERVVREGKEAKIKDYYLAGDMAKVDEILGEYPYKERPEISLEQAHHVARSAIKNTTQDTVEMDAVVL
jgi:hypothetical protein